MKSGAYYMYRQANFLAFIALLPFLLAIWAIKKLWATARARYRARKHTPSAPQN